MCLASIPSFHPVLLLIQPSIFFSSLSFLNKNLLTLHSPWNFPSTSCLLDYVFLSLREPLKLSYPTSSFLYPNHGPCWSQDPTGLIIQPGSGQSLSVCQNPAQFSRLQVTCFKNSLFTCCLGLFFEKESSVLPKLASNLQWSACFCFLNTGITGMNPTTPDFFWRVLCDPSNT